MNSESTVFLVEDEVSVLRAISRLLRSAGLNVETFRSGQELQRYDPHATGCLVSTQVKGLNTPKDIPY